MVNLITINTMTTSGLELQKAWVVFGERDSRSF
jgi:hypothetical protein